MKSLARHASLAAVVGALLVFSGCTTTQSARTERIRPDYQIAVLESSKGLEVTPQLLAELRTSAMNFLRENGLSQNGEYVMRVNLTPDQPEDTGQWVVLRVSNVPTRTYTLLAAYPGADDFYPEDFYGYYNYAFPSFARYGYYDPFDYGYGYGSGYFPPPVYVPNRPHQPGDKDNRPPSNHTRWDGSHPDPDHPGTTGHQPDVNHPRTDNHQPDPDHPRTRDHQPNPDNTRTWDHPRRDNDGGSSWSGRGGGSSGGNSNTTPPRPESSYSPPARSEPSYSPPASSSPAPERSSPPAQSRDERNNQQN